MTDRPTERDLELDAIDDVFKQAITQFAKDFAQWEGKPQAGIPDPNKFVMDGIARVRAARLAMIAKLG
jgi:hypothetical protein